MTIEISDLHKSTCKGCDGTMYSRRKGLTVADLPEGTAWHAGRGLCTVCDAKRRCAERGRTAREARLAVANAPASPEIIDRMTSGTAAWLRERRKRIARQAWLRKQGLRA